MLREQLPADPPRVVIGSGDDAAVTLPEGATATSIDAVVDGIHFHREWATPTQIGHKALAAALSDLAAMGAQTGEAYLALFVPPDLTRSDFFAIQEGVQKLAEETGTALVGGDLVRSPVLSLAVTVVGHRPEPKDFVTRAGARPGDLIVVTGELGGAGAGLALLNEPELSDRSGLDRPTIEALIRRQLEPRPQLEAGLALAIAGATAMIDISDGLGADAGHLAKAGRVQLAIDLTSTPFADGLAEVADVAGRDREVMGTGEGEDYELLACLPPSALSEARERLAAVDVELSVIGEVKTGTGVEMIGAGGRAVKPSGYDQLD